LEAARARWQLAGGAHRCGGATAARCGGARWRPHRREGRGRLRLAPGATREDERGEGGSKSKNGGGWVGLTVGGGDGGGQKCAGEGHSGSIVGMDERRLAWPYAEEGEGEKERRARWRRSAF
jgi:hypothetical protein